MSTTFAVIPPGVPACAPAIPRRDPRILGTIRFVEENCARPLRIADLADVADLSISRFCHLFRTQCGTSPKRMLRYIRLAR